MGAGYAVCLVFYFYSCDPDLQWKHVTSMSCWNWLENIRSDTHVERGGGGWGVVLGHSVWMEPEWCAGLALIEEQRRKFGPSSAARNGSRTVPDSATEELLFLAVHFRSESSSRVAGSQRQTERQKQTAAGMWRPAPGKILNSPSSLKSSDSALTVCLVWSNCQDWSYIRRL